jgi:transposase
MAIMTLCLLVYGLTQYRLRQASQQHDEILPNQKKKPTKTSTLMWIFCLFASITVVTVSEEEKEGGGGKEGGKSKERQTGSVKYTAYS